jgi:hypothetical protein
VHGSKITFMIITDFNLKNSSCFSCGRLTLRESRLNRTDWIPSRVGKGDVLLWYVCVGIHAFTSPLRIRDLAVFTCMNCMEQWCGNDVFWSVC